MATIFTKRFEEITYEDIAQLIENEVPESEVLDYKQKWTSTKKVANLISAFANTYGGFIVFGVSEKENSNLPEEIVGLVDSEKELDAKLYSSCYDNISPPVIVSSRIIKNEENGKVVFVIKVPESDLAPHAVEDNTTIYLKIGSQKRPGKKVEYERANLNEFEWLRNRREKYVRLRKSLYDRAISNLGNYHKKSKGTRPTFRHTIMPKYPKTPLVRVTEFPSVVQNTIQIFKRKYPHTPIGTDRLVHYNNGLIDAFSTDIADILFDFNSLGLYNFAISFDKVDKDAERIDLTWVVNFANLSYVLAFEYLKQLDFSGLVIIDTELSNIKNAKLRHYYMHGRSFAELLSLSSKIENKCILEHECLAGGLLEKSSELIGDFLTGLLYIFGLDREIDSMANSLIDAAKSGH